MIDPEVPMSYDITMTINSGSKYLNESNMTFLNSSECVSRKNRYIYGNIQSHLNSSFEREISSADLCFV